MIDPSKDYYAALGVLPSIEPAAIRAVYLALLKKYHPDVYNGASDEAIRRTKEFNEAYKVLGDEKRREKYDRLRAGSAYGEQRATSRRHEAKTTDYRDPSTAKQHDAQQKTDQFRGLVVGIMGIVALVFILTVFGGSD
jgi:curved DNA-binding protein CbpA